jgi:CYTH domain-containing protein
VIEVELEKTYLAKALPKGLKDSPSEVIRDAYVPVQYEHPIVRLRQRGERHEITKKEQTDPKDASRHDEHTIHLTKEEFAALLTDHAKTHAKRRFDCTIDGAKAEVDVYLEALQGLVVIDFEFDTPEAMAAFRPPAICLADVTNEDVLAGGMIAGKTYEDLRPTLEKYGYKPLQVEEVL